MGRMCPYMKIPLCSKGITMTSFKLPTIVFDMGSKMIKYLNKATNMTLFYLMTSFQEVVIVACVPSLNE